MQQFSLMLTAAPILIIVQGSKAARDALSGNVPFAQWKREVLLSTKETNPPPIATAWILLGFALLWMKYPGPHVSKQSSALVRTSYREVPLSKRNSRLVAPEEKASTSCCVISA